MSVAAMIGQRNRNVNAGSARDIRSYRSSRGTPRRPVGVRRTSCSAGNNVYATIHAMTKPIAIQMPIWRIGRICETASAPKPIAAAMVDAVTGRNLLRSAIS